MIIVSHEMNSPASVADRVLFMHGATSSRPPRRSNSSTGRSPTAPKASLQKASGTDCLRSREHYWLDFPMNLAASAQGPRVAGKPVRVALIGAGKFGSMFLSQVPTYARPGSSGHRRPRSGARARGLPHRRLGRGADRGDRIYRRGAEGAADDIEVIVEATGNPAAGIRHARAAIAAGKHIVMVNVEADVLAGPLLAARRARPAWSIRWPMATSRR